MRSAPAGFLTGLCGLRLPGYCRSRDALMHMSPSVDSILFPSWSELSEPCIAALRCEPRGAAASTADRLTTAIAIARS